MKVNSIMEKCLLAVGAGFFIFMMLAYLSQVLAADEQQTLSAWDWFMSLDNDRQWKTAGFVLLPEILAIVSSIALMATINKLYELGDKARFPLALAVSGAIGVILMATFRDLINGLLHYQIITTAIVAGAFPITGLLNHLCFRLLIAVLYLIWLIGESIPADFKLLGMGVGWLGKPLMGISKFAYRTLTTKGIECKKKGGKQSVDDGDPIAGEITQQMATKYIDPERASKSDPDITPTPKP